MSSLDALSRLVTHHQVVIDTRFRTKKIDENDKQNCTCPVPTMEKLADLIIAQKGFKAEYQNAEVTLTLQDAEKCQKKGSGVPTHLALLVNVVDKTGSATVLRNIKTSARREIIPEHQKGEGYEVSAHILIALEGKNRTYDMVYTPIPKTSTGRINSFLNKILLKVAQSNETVFTSNETTNITNPTNGKKKKVRYKAIFDLNGKLDQELFNKINKEGLADVVFIKNETQTLNAPDVNQAIIPRTSTLRIMPNHDGQNVISWIKNVSHFFRDNSNGGFQLVKIKFKEPESDALRTVEMDTANVRLDSLEKTFIKKTKIDGFSSRLIDSYVKLHNESVVKMIDII